MESMHKREGSSEGTEEKDEGIAMKVWDCGSPLYDSYELASLGHVIDRHVLVLPVLSGSWRPKKQISHSSAVSQYQKRREDLERLKGLQWWAVLVICWRRLCAGRSGERKKREERRP